MKFGDYLKQKREKLHWTQPEAAAQIDIEQSYLSKLETGKSYPSEEVFSRLITAYRIDTTDMSEQVSSTDLDKLKEIKEVRTAVLNHRKSERTMIRGWLVAGLALLIFGGACLGLSLILPNQETQEFHYRSTGVLLPGESLNAFDIIDWNIRPDNPDYDNLHKRQSAMTQRIDQKYQVLTNHLDRNFIEDVDNGKRYYELYDDRVVSNISPLRWLLAPAFMLMMGSIGCFFISFRWQ